MTKLTDLLGKEILFFDGGSGTILQSMGLKPGELPETWNLTHPENVVKLNYDYFAAGSNIVNTNTFGAFYTKFPLNLEKIITAAIDNANHARQQALQNFQSTHAAPNYFIAFDIGSCGKLLKPMGDLDFEDCVKLYSKSFEIAFKCNIDCVLIETMNDGYETKAAVLAAKETMEKLNVKFPIIVSNVYDKECRTLSGSTPETMVALLEGLGVDAIGVNCSLGPLEMKETVRRLCQAATVPVLVKPNAGLPKVVDGKTLFDVPVEKFAQAMKTISEYGPMILGGCCGTTPEYIKAIQDLKFSTPKKNSLSTPKEFKTIISSNSQTVEFSDQKPCVLIGERINPTGKKKFKEALRNKDIAYIIHQGIEQEEAGAQVLDVNVGLPEIDEKEMMVTVITELQSVTELPLQIDTSSPEVMEAALRRYNGKPLINSVNGKQEVMDAVFPLVKKYGGVVIALTLDENGIPANSQGRISIAQKIYTEAQKYGIQKHDIIIDPLAMAISSDTKAALATLETVKAIHQQGGRTSLGISNISFGLPNREFVTASFFTLCMQNGLSAAIMNPLQQEMKKAYHTFNLLNGHDENCTNYIEWATKYGESLPLAPAAPVSHSSTAASSATPSNGAPQSTNEPRNAPEQLSPLANAIIHGLKDDAAKLTKEQLQTTDSLEIINSHLIPGLDFVGKKFEQKKMYLPQLLMAAEAAKSAFSEIRQYMEKTGTKGDSKGKILIATVKGDIHDIGKNIVKVLLENYDFTVIDLGKDVPPETIVEACKKDKIKLVGLSALMTTTVASMEETIKQLRKECPWTKVCVGGAVMTQEYADQIGANFYGKDAMDTVRYACSLADQGELE
ncbi:MAG: homocysteine S-methyltransferase family protein [Treponema sp.]|nr:homocysteine S-methyltransferase family protein [Treponema sp.]